MSKEITIIRSAQEGFSRKMNKENTERYINICMHIWGGCPRDIDWATGTSIYKEEAMRRNWVDLEKAKLDSKLTKW